eukprot:1119069-Alexandrium_andersonii.AAC.1
MMHMSTACAAPCPAEQHKTTEGPQTNGSKSKTKEDKEKRTLKRPRSETRNGHEPKRPLARTELHR